MDLFAFRSFCKIKFQEILAFINLDYAGKRCWPSSLIQSHLFCVMELTVESLVECDVFTRNAAVSPRTERGMGTLDVYLISKIRLN